MIALQYAGLAATFLLLFVYVSRVYYARKYKGWRKRYAKACLYTPQQYFTTRYPGYIGGNSRDRRKIRRRGVRCVRVGE